MRHLNLEGEIRFPKGLHLKRVEFDGLFDKLFLEERVLVYHRTEDKKKRVSIVFSILGLITIGSIIGIFVLGSNSDSLVVGLPSYVLPAIVMSVAGCPTVFIIMYWHTLDITSLRILEERQRIFFQNMHTTGLEFKIRKSKRKPDLIFTTTALSSSVQEEYVRFVVLSRILSKNDPSKIMYKIIFGYDIAAKIEQELRTEDS